MIRKKKKSIAFETAAVLIVFAFLSLGNALTRNDVNSKISDGIYAAERAVERVAFENAVGEK